MSKKIKLLFWERTYTANYESLPYLNPDEINISVEDALRLAENNGGEEVREKLGNSCSIKIKTSEGVVDNDWVIRYTKDGNTRLEMFVDEQTGKSINYSLLNKADNRTKARKLQRSIYFSRGKSIVKVVPLPS